MQCDTHMFFYRLLLGGQNRKITDHKEEVFMNIKYISQVFEHPRLQIVLLVCPVCRVCCVNVHGPHVKLLEEVAPFWEWVAQQVRKHNPRNYFVIFSGTSTQHLQRRRGDAGEGSNFARLNRGFLNQ